MLGSYCLIAQQVYSFSDNFIPKDEPFYINFRSSIKKMAMSSQIGVPIQILKQTTIDPHDRTTQNAAIKSYVPELKTYPGAYVPAPFEVIKARGDSSYKEICKEILALTKLNWNTADFCSGLPITIGFSRNVGQVLKVFEDDDAEQPAQIYRFYM